MLACSALKRAYRDRLARAGDVRFVHLKGTYETIAARLAGRAHRYMPPTLLASQFATLEEPDAAIVVDIADSVPDQVGADPHRAQDRRVPRVSAAGPSQGANGSLSEGRRAAPRVHS